MTTDQQRQEFQKWATKDFYADLASPADTWDAERQTYNEFAHHMAWCAYQAGAAQSAGWQDIATAPKDGTFVLLYRRGKVRSAAWSPDACSGQGQWLVGPYVAAFGHIDEATHWMPLPTPPKARP